MMRSTTTRRWVTGISVAILLLCQTMAAALAYVAAPAAASGESAFAAAAMPPCHESQAADDTTPSINCHDRCPSRDAAVETSKINIPAAVSLALSAIIADLSYGITQLTTRYNRIIANAAPPPPLRLVYCRLLN